MAERLDEAVRSYIDAIEPEHRALFDRLHQLILDEHPDATVEVSYRMPTYKVGNRRLYVATWKHGVSVYGWRQEDPELVTGKGTIRFRPVDADGVADDELRDLVRAALDPLGN